MIEVKRVESEKKPTGEMTEKEATEELERLRVILNRGNPLTLIAKELQRIRRALEFIAGAKGFVSEDNRD